MKICIDAFFLFLAVLLSIGLYVLQEQIYMGLVVLKVIIAVVVSFSAAYFVSSKIKQILRHGK
ncbi:hypothetical protein [Cysteiniphilum litorale]|uniref:hypothetical protein n=1 Tax=Cysteiniphilum litorale TaxID=2056700 RepID=UPI003F882EB9